MKVIGILVGYYPQYARSSTRVFAELVSKIAPERELWFVDNSAGGLAAPVGYRRVPGDNRVQEFTAWDAGLLQQATLSSASDDDIVVIANDTFCNHHDFSVVDRYFFLRQLRLRLIVQDGSAIVGEVNFVRGKSFQILGLKSERWISTYLFAARARELKALQPLAIDEAQLLELVNDCHEPARFFAAALDPALAEFSKQWLFDPGARQAWYKAQPLLPENQSIMYRKARAMLCEQYLSARATAMGFDLVHSHGSPLYRVYKRIRRYWRSVRSKCA